MSFTSSAGVWVESAGLADMFEADKPVTTYRARLLHYNLRHLSDTSTQERVSIVSLVGGSVVSSDAGSAPLASPVLAITTPWTVMRPRRLARPVLRIGAKVTSGTGYLSAALFPVGARQNADFRGALASWSETSFTNTSHAVIIEAGADITWQESKPPTAWAPQPVVLDGFRGFVGNDPSDGGSDEPSKVKLVLVDLVIWGRGAAIDVSLIQLREFCGP